jgi:lipid A 3-O-deacylase
MRRFLLAVLLATLATPAAAQDAAEWSWRGTYSVLVENDKFSSFDQAKQTDRNFTNGVRFNWMSEPGLRWGPLRELAGWIPVFDASGKTRAGLGFGQNMYTPEDISRRDLITNDRPYSGWTYLSAALTSDLGSGQNRGRLDTLELQVGIIGPQSYAEQTQKEYHKLIGAQLPMGWGNQLKNEPGVALFYERKWRRLETPLPKLPLFEIDMTPHVGGSVGNVFTYAAAGATFRIGRDLAVDYGPPRIRPGLAGSLHVDPPADGYAYYAFFGFEGRAVARDVTLDGNTFAKSHSVNRNPLVGDLQMGVAGVVGRARGTFSYVMRTREFEGQNKPDRFGALSLSWRF